jgi:single-strand DNA-binding protein
VTNTEWHNIKYWINSDNLTQYLTKGKTIAIEGKLKTDVYEKDGQKRYTTYVLANSVCFVSSSNKKEQKDEDDLPEEAVKDEDDLPF